MARAWPRRPRSRVRAGRGVARRAPLRRRRRAARRASRSALYQWYTDSAWWLMLTPAVSSVALAAAASPVAGGDGVVEPVDQVALLGQPLEQLGLVRRRRRAHPVRAPSAKKAAAWVWAPDRAAARPARGGVAQRRAPGRRRRRRGGRGRRGRRAATPRARRACRRWNDTSPPGGRVPLMAMRQRSWRKRDAARPAPDQPGLVEGAQGGQPDAEAERAGGRGSPRARTPAGGAGPRPRRRGRWCGPGPRRARCGGSRRRRGRASRPRRRGCRR